MSYIYDWKCIFSVLKGIGAIKYAKHFGFYDNIECQSDSMEFGVSKWKQEIIEADYIKEIHRLIWKNRT